MLRKSLFLVLLAATPAAAKDRTPIRDNATDGGVPSAETLGRGNTFAADMGGPASGSENPANLIDSSQNAMFGTARVATDSNLDDDVALGNDPLEGKVMQYFSLAGEKGVIFYEPISRINDTEILNPASPSTDYRQVEYDANAFGIAGAEQFGQGSIGLSIAYLHSSINVIEKQTGVPDKNNYDTADGVRMNVGVRYPTGPAMWGLVVQNAPGMMWGKDYKKNILPFKARIGNRVRVAKDLYLSGDWERRYYHEGSNDESYYYLGAEAFTSTYAVLRGGYFGRDLNKSDRRTATAGITFIARSGARISYTMEMFEVNNEHVRSSLVSLQLPFQSEEETSTRK